MCVWVDLSWTKWRWNKVSSKSLRFSPSNFHSTIAPYSSVPPTRQHTATYFVCKFAGLESDRYLALTLGEEAIFFCMSPTSNAEVKERVELYLYSNSGPSWPVPGWPLPLHFTFVCHICFYKNSQRQTNEWKLIVLLYSWALWGWVVDQSTTVQALRNVLSVHSLAEFRCLECQCLL
jgi:hypothetical protein